MSFLNKNTGQFGEDLAAKFLKRKGFKILERNRVSALGEIDILAMQKSDIVIVEVKTKSTKSYGAGYEMVNYFKKKKLITLAKELQIEYPGRTIRIDVISVDLSSSDYQIQHFINAVEEN